MTYLYRNRGFWELVELIRALSAFRKLLSEKNPFRVECGGNFA